MTQVVEFRKLSACAPRQHSWRHRLRAWLFDRPAREKQIPWDQRSSHLLRDIGLAEGVRANDLLRDSAFKWR
jgi:hypothetical protein